MCQEHNWKYIAEHLNVCTDCGLEDLRPNILAEANYTFQTLRYPPYSRRMRFGPLLDHLAQHLQREIFDLYETILSRWKRTDKRRSRYFYNRKLMFAYLFSKVSNTKFNNILQNLESQNAQILEMQYLLENEPIIEVPEIIQTHMETIWALFDQE